MTDNKIISTPVKKQTLAEQMAEHITQLILDGTLVSEESLPTEPQLAVQFGVSRAVVRDATRILMAKGLVDVQHGKGVFVTKSKNNTFGDALLLALQRAEATAWDVEEFERSLYPEILALAAQNATEGEIKSLEKQADACIVFVENYYTMWADTPPPKAEQEYFRLVFQKFSELLFASTHNKVMEQLATPLLGLRNLRDWKENDELTKEDYVNLEKQILDKLIEIVKTKDSAIAREMARNIYKLPPEAITAMKNTPVGNIVKIDISIPKNYQPGN